METEIKKIEYHHTTLNKVYSIDREISIDEFYKFQESDNPETLGYKYERDYPSITAAQPETV
jgi:hypothetical protein